jgi:alpha,alpha-trehalose phosphorylase (configuration-retaining)
LVTKPPQRFALLTNVPPRYVPKPKPGVFRITKTVHNILQGVSKPDEWITPEEKKILTDWITDNAKRYWFSDGGPLRPPEEGGADVIFVSLSLPIFGKRTNEARSMILKCPDLFH